MLVIHYAFLFKMALVITSLFNCEVILCSDFNHTTHFFSTWIHTKVPAGYKASYK